MKFYFDEKGFRIKYEEIGENEEVYFVGNYAYDKKKRKEEIISGTPPNFDREKEMFIYDKQGNLITFYFRDEGGEEVMQNEFRYTYDKKKNWILSEKFEDGRLSLISKEK